MNPPRLYQQGLALKGPVRRGTPATATWGWTMACGTARITADLIGGRKPDLPLDGLMLH